MPENYLIQKYCLKVLQITDYQLIVNNSQKMLPTALLDK